MAIITSLNSAKDVFCAIMRRIKTPTYSIDFLSPKLYAVMSSPVTKLGSP